MKKNKIWLIGASQMAVDYAKVLKALNIDFITIGRGIESANNFTKETGNEVIRGGIEKYINSKPIKPDAAIVAVGVEQLKSAAEILLHYGIKKILLEKPGGLTTNEVVELNSIAKNYSADVFIGYNRRFYSSVIKSKEIIREDGGIQSFNFEFTEWSHIIEKMVKAKGVKDSWFISNSSHVIDTAFYIGGKPSRISSYTAGELSWHKPAIFSGAGVTTTNALFSYTANWQAPGRWGIEFLTKKHRLILRPIEKLQIQELGSISTSFIDIDDKLDQLYKPGLYLQTKAFMDNIYNDLCTLSEQATSLKDYYRKMSEIAF